MKVILETERLFLRLPDFVTKDDFDWAVREAAVKKRIVYLAILVMKGLLIGKGRNLP